MAFYPTPTASPFVDIGQYVGLLLAAIDEALDRADVWDEGDAATAQGYMEDLKAWIAELEILPMIGTIFAYATAEFPQNCLPCDGAIYQRSDYPELYDALNEVFRVTAYSFFVPELRGRMILGMGGADIGYTEYPLAYPGGAETHLLTYYEMPPHAHTEVQSNGLLANISTDSPNRWIGDAPFNTTTGVTPPAETAQVAHNNMPPFLTLPYCIRAR